MTSKVARRLCKNVDFVEAEFKVASSKHDVSATPGKIPPGNPRFAALKLIGPKDLDSKRRELCKYTPASLKISFWTKVRRIFTRL